MLTINLFINTLPEVWSVSCKHKVKPKSYSFYLVVFFFFFMCLGACVPKNVCNSLLGSRELTYCSYWSLVLKSTQKPGYWWQGRPKESGNTDNTHTMCTCARGFRGLQISVRLFLQDLICWDEKSVKLFQDYV